MKNKWYRLIKKGETRQDKPHCIGSWNGCRDNLKNRVRSTVDYALGDWGHWAIVPLTKTQQDCVDSREVVMACTEMFLREKKSHTGKEIAQEAGVSYSKTMKILGDEAFDSWKLNHSYSYPGKGKVGMWSPSKKFIIRTLYEASEFCTKTHNEDFGL